MAFAADSGVIMAFAAAQRHDHEPARLVDEIEISA